ncbi:MAG: AraC family transcriptional regulator [Fibrobacterales bacterium]
MTTPIQYENITPDSSHHVYLSRVDQEPSDTFWNFTHFHKLHEIIKYNYVSGGVLSIDGVEYELVPNTLVFIPSMSVHDIRFPTDSRRSWSLLQFEPTLLTAYNFRQVKEIFNTPSVSVLTNEINDHFDYLFNWYQEVYQSENRALAQRIISLILQLVLDQIRQAPIIENTPIRPSKGILQFTPLLKHLEENSIYNLPLDKAAKLCGLSKFHFSRLFKSYFDLTYNEYLLKRKINSAITLLNNQNVSIAKIAEQCGFNDTAYFCKKFKQETSKTPKEYRSSFNVE